MKKILAYLLISCFWSVSAAGVDFTGRTEFGLDELWGMTDLLSVRCIGQDDDGMIWFGTDTQLMSYDGHSVQAFPCDWGNIKTDCLQIAGDIIYIGSASGLVRFDKSNGTFTSDEEFKGHMVRAMLIHDGLLFLGTDKGLHAVDIASNTLMGFHQTGSLGRLNIFSLCENRGVLFIGTDDYIYSYDIEKGTLLNISSTLPGGKKSLNNKTITEGIYADEAMLLAGTQKALSSISPLFGVRILHEFKTVKTIIRDEEGKFLIGTDGGLFRYAIEKNEAVKISDDVVKCGFVDNQRNIWLGTDSGLRIHKKDKIFNQIQLPEGVESAAFTSGMRDSRGRIWLCSNRGMILLDDEAGDIWFRIDNPEHPIEHNKIKDILELPDKRIVASSDSGYLVFDEGRRQFENHMVEKSDNWFYDMDNHGDTLWIAGYDGLLKMKGDEVLKLYTFGEQESENDVAHVCADSNGGAVVLTRNQEIFYLDKKTDRFVKLDISFFKIPVAEHILIDSRDRLWIASRKELACIDAGGNRTMIDMSERASAMIHCLEEIEGVILAGTSRGLCLVYDSSRAVFFNTNGNYINAVYDRPSRTILLMSKGRVSYVNIDDVTRIFRRHTHKPVVTGIEANGNYSIPYHELKDGNIVLEEDMKNLVISLSDFDYSDDMRQRFLYKLDRQGGRWKPVIPFNRIVLPPLSAGRHKLYFKTDGQEGYEEFVFTIKRPWYRSVFMMSLYIFILVSCLITMIRSIIGMRRMKIEKTMRETALRQAQEKEEFFVTVAHELKTPLSLVIAPLGKLISESKDESELKTLRMAQENALKLNAMVHNTIGIYSDTADVAGCMTYVDVDIPEFVQSVISSYSENYKNLEFIVDCQPQKMLLSIDITKMESVLNNLISNACKYTKDDGSIIVTARYSAETQMLELSVSDTGIGIPKDELPFIFHRFFESSRTKGKHYDSTGVGLSIIKNYVEAMNGTVVVESDGNGTSFKITVPCKNAANETAEGGTAASDNEGKPLIAIVEDNIQICSFLESTLSPHYRCLSVHNGKSGLKLCKDVLPDLIISDIIMPVMDGLEMCREIRKFAPLSTVPVILLTAKNDKDTELQSLNLNIEAFIPKPFDTEILMLKINQLLDSKRRMEKTVRLEMATNVEVPEELSQDEKTLKKITGLIEDHIDDCTLTVTKLSELSGLPEKQLYRKIKQLTGMSTVEYIRSIRLKKAALLLLKGSFTVAEVMYNVGFSNMSYFSRAFTAEYGMPPSAYMKSKENGHGPAQN